MATDAGRWGPRPRVPAEWLGPLVAGVVYALVIAVTVAFRETSDFRDFWENAAHFRQTGEISSQLGVHNYLPFFTVFVLPWGLLPLKVASVLFSVLSVVLFAGAALLAEHLLHDGLGPRPRPAFLLALGLALPYAHSCAVLGNVGLLVLFLLVATWFLVERGHEAAAGVALGLAVLIKLLPAVLLVFFVMKRRWRVVGSAMATAVLLGLGLPLAALGPRATLAQHGAFYERAVRGGSAGATITADQPQKALYTNNALPIVLRRLLSPVDCGTARSGPLYVNLANLPRPVILAAYSAGLVLIVALSVGGTLGPRTWPPATPGAGQAVRAQFGLWCAVMLLASPLLWTHYLPLVYWPLALLADRWERVLRAKHRWDRLATAALTLWLLGAVLLAWPAARAAGAQLASVLVVWLAAVALARRRAGPSASP